MAHLRRSFMKYEVRLWKPKADKLVTIATSKNSGDACTVAEALYKEFKTQAEVWENDGKHAPRRTVRLDEEGWTFWEDPTHARRSS